MFDNITVPQRLSFKEFLSVMLFVFASSKRLRWYILFMILIMSSSQFLGFLTVRNAEVNFHSLLDTLFFIVKVLVCYALGGVIVVTILVTVIYRFHPYFFNNVSYDFTHWGITRNGERTNFSKPWREITKYKESKRFFVIYAKFDPHVIQKSMLGNDEKIDNFRTMLNANVAGK